MPAERPLLVAGASSDIGVALIKRVLRSGDRRVIAQVKSGGDRLRELQSDRLTVVPADLGTADGVDALLAEARRSDATPEGLVYLPALPLIYERGGRIDVARLELDLQVQVISLVRLLNALLPEMARAHALDQSRRGKVVVISSSAVLGVPPAYSTAYTACKYAQLGLVKSLAAEFGKKGVNLNLVAPSMVETRFLGSIPAKAIEMAAGQHPMGRNAGVDDIVPSIEFLLSAGSDYVNGATLVVSGGLVM